MKGNRFLSIAVFDGKKSVSVNFDYLMEELKGLAGIITVEELVKYKGDGGQLMLDRLAFLVRTLEALKAQLLQELSSLRVQEKVESEAPKPAEKSEKKEEGGLVAPSLPEKKKVEEVDDDEGLDGDDDEVGLDELGLSDEDLEGLDLDVDLDKAKGE